MRDITRNALATAIVTLCALAVSLPSAALERVDGSTPSDTTPATSAPAPPETTEPEPEPDETTPDDTTPDDTTPDDTLVGAGNPDDDIDTTVAVIAVIGFLILLAVASWWMVRRSNPDEQPKPPRPDGPAPSDLI